MKNATTDCHTLRSVNYHLHAIIIIIIIIIINEYLEAGLTASIFCPTYPL